MDYFTPPNGGPYLNVSKKGVTMFQNLLELATLLMAFGSTCAATAVYFVQSRLLPRMITDQLNRLNIEFDPLLPPAGKLSEEFPGEIAYYAPWLSGICCAFTAFFLFVELGQVAFIPMGLAMLLAWLGIYSALYGWFHSALDEIALRKRLATEYERHVGYIIDVRADAWQNDKASLTLKLGRKAPEETFSLPGHLVKEVKERYVIWPAGSLVVFTVSGTVKYVFPPVGLLPESEGEVSSESQDVRSSLDPIAHSAPGR